MGKQHFVEINKLKKNTHNSTLILKSFISLQITWEFGIFTGVFKLVDVCGADSVGLIACFTTRPPKKLKVCFHTGIFVYIYVELSEDNGTKTQTKLLIYNIIK
jgi:hypothetical protein